MDCVPVRAFIQARMESSRYPGKVLAPLGGKPVIQRVIERVAEVLEPDCIVVLTSRDKTDDPLEAFLRLRDVNLFRGDLNNVFGRYLSALEDYPCEGFFRVNGDSPFLEPPPFERTLEIREKSSYDLITTKGSDSLPYGKNTEFIASDTFTNLDVEALNEKEREHVVNHFYNNPKKYSIRHISCSYPENEYPMYCVDEVEDINRLESEVISNEENMRILESNSV